MQSQSLHTTVLLSLSLGARSLSPCIAQSPARSTSSTAMAGQEQDTDPAKNDTVSGLPTFLLKVPSGNVLMGMPVETFIEACSQAVYPFNPKFAYRDATKNLATAMRRSSSVIGRKPVPVDTFFLGKWPVKNSEYITYVDQRRAARELDAKGPPFCMILRHAFVFLPGARCVKIFSPGLGV